MVAHPPQQKEIEGQPAWEADIHTPPGAHHPGEPRTAGEDKTTLHLTIKDASTGEPTCARVNVIGSDGHYYEPAENPLSPWSLHRLGNRPSKGPYRHYGWYFFCRGQADVHVPPGEALVEIHKGYEFAPQIVRVQMERGLPTDLTVTLRRVVDMAALGYASGDTHLHLQRNTPEDDEHTLDLLQAEDLRYGTVLCMNDPAGPYFGGMDRQEWPQRLGLGAASARTRNLYTVASGQEYRTNQYGHFVLLMQPQLAHANQTFDPNLWPVFGLVGQETRKLGGYSLHAHGGYGKEIYADFPLNSSDGVELLQFAVYRGIALQAWYKILNAGFVFPAVGASDYPYCRALGDCRTYAWTSGQMTLANWYGAISKGQSLMTTGPLVLLELNGARPGERIPASGQTFKGTVSIRVCSPVAAASTLQLLQNGQVVQSWQIPPEEQRTGWWRVTCPVECEQSSWFAARAFSDEPETRPNAEAHTNPVYVDLNGRVPHNPADLDWLLARLNEQRAVEAARSPFPEQPMVLRYYDDAARVLLRRKAAGPMLAPGTE